MPGLLVPAGDDNAIAFSRECDSRRAANAGQRAGDQNDGVFISSL
jgi:hypothetical protein